MKSRRFLMKRRALIVDLVLWGILRVDVPGRRVEAFNLCQLLLFIFGASSPEQHPAEEDAKCDHKRYPNSQPHSQSNLEAVVVVV